MSEYAFNPDLPFVRSDCRGNVKIKNRFVNEDRRFDLTYSKLLRWVFSANPQRAEKKADPFQLVPEPDRRIFEKGSDAFVWLGHAAFLFRINNKRILTDPCLYSLPNVPRRFPSPFPTEELRHIDYILLTHSHRDHFDTRSMRELLVVNPEVKIYCALNMIPLVRAVGGKNIIDAGWYQEFPPDETGIRFVFLPAKHWNRRYLHDTNRELWGAFWIGSETQSIYFAGDTAYHAHFKDARETLPPIKHAFLPVGAYKPDYIMKHSHTSPSEAVQAFQDLGARHFIPMHYGTYDLSDEPPGEPLRLLSELLKNEEQLADQIVPGAVYPL
jgi:L-ascorbate metabolism protein UlaG (beta-lactamase superfamily)